MLILKMVYETDVKRQAEHTQKIILCSTTATLTIQAGKTDVYTVKKNSLSNKDYCLTVSS